jgi:hypothetical protein
VEEGRPDLPAHSTLRYASAGAAAITRYTHYLRVALWPRLAGAPAAYDDESVVDSKALTRSLHCNPRTLKNIFSSSNIAYDAHVVRLRSSKRQTLASGNGTPPIIKQVVPHAKVVLAFKRLLRINPHQSRRKEATDYVYNCADHFHGAR